MTLEALLDMSADELEKMDDQQLMEHFGKYLNVTRPEMAPKPQRLSSPSRQQSFLPMNNQVNAVIAKLAAAGTDVSHLFKKKFKR